MSRRKGLAVDVPGSAEEATELLARYVEAERRALEVRLRTQTSIDRLAADRDAVLASVAVDQAGRFAQLKAWWEAGGKDVAKGKRSAELAGAQLGIRLSPPKLKLPKGRNARQVLSDLLAWLGGDFVRTTHALDKPAIIAALRRRLPDEPSAEQLHDRRVLADELALTVVQTDEFFIDCGLDEDAIRAANQTTEE